jgi:hypothetical protein
MTSSFLFRKRYTVNITKQKDNNNSVSAVYNFGCDQGPWSAGVTKTKNAERTSFQGILIFRVHNTFRKYSTWNGWC